MERKSYVSTWSRNFTIFLLLTSDHSCVTYLAGASDLMVFSYIVNICIHKVRSECSMIVLGIKEGWCTYQICFCLKLIIIFFFRLG